MMPLPSKGNLAAWMLFGVAGWHLLCAVPIGRATGDDFRLPLGVAFDSATVEILSGALFAMLGCWALYRPLPAVMTGLALFVSVGIYQLAAVPQVVTKGACVIKLILAVLLLAGVTQSWASRGR